jgi:hypothetical protein
MYRMPSVVAATGLGPAAHISRHAPSICRMLKLTSSFMAALQ